ncbi:MAG: ATP-binding protein [Thermodesulfobacteriota bacterium]
MISIENFFEKIASGEDSSRQFKADVRNAESLASEMVAFANSEGGTLFIGGPMTVPFLD